MSSSACRRLRRKRSRILYLDHVEGDGRLLFEQIVKLDLEGIQFLQRSLTFDEWDAHVFPEVQHVIVHKFACRGSIHDEMRLRSMANPKSHRAQEGRQQFKPSLSGPALLAPSGLQTTAQQPSSPCLAHSDCCRRSLRKSPHWPCYFPLR